MSQSAKKLVPFDSKNGKPSFEETWQAEVLAIADLLIQRGHISRKIWADALGNELAVARQSNEPDTAETYYRCVLRAIEHLLEQKISITRKELNLREDEWRSAYMRTPHGQPVVLSSG